MTIKTIIALVVVGNILGVLGGLLEAIIHGKIMFTFGRHVEEQKSMNRVNWRDEGF